MALRINDYVHRGNGITVTFSDGDVCDITYEYDPVEEQMIVVGCPEGPKRVLIESYLDSDPTDDLAKVDARFIDRRPEYRSIAFSLLGIASTVVPIPMNRIVNMQWLDPPLGPLLTPVGTIDPGNVSTTDAFLINGNLTDLCYNDNSFGSANKELPAIDLGSNVNIGNLSIYWWNQIYVATNFDIEYSTNGTTWTAISGFTGTWLGPTVAQQVQFPFVNARYIRIRCITGADPNFCVVSEMQCYGPSALPPTRRLLDLSEQAIVVSEVGANLTEFRSTRGGKIDIIVYYLVG